MRVHYVAIAIVLSLLAGCESNSKSREMAADRQKQQDKLEEKKVVETIIVDACKKDPENADMWRQMGISLFSDPSRGQKRIVGKIPACESITVDVLDKKVVDGVMFYRIQYGGQDGWQTRRLLTDAGNPDAN